MMKLKLKSAALQLALLTLLNASAQAMGVAMFSGAPPVNSIPESAISQTLSRTECYAPCHIHLHMVGTGDGLFDNPFELLYYTTTWGKTGTSEANVGSFLYGPVNANRNKDISIGPVAATVYETPGTYVVRTTVRSVTGLTGSKQQTVTIHAFDDADTYCINASGSDFTGCPHAVGARQITQSNFNTIFSTYVLTGRKVLLKCGDTFTSDPGVAGSPNNTLDATTQAGPLHIGRFGTCAASGDRPADKATLQFTAGAGGLNFIQLGTNHEGDVRITDIHFDTQWVEGVPNSVGYYVSPILGGRQGTSNILYHKLDGNYLEAWMGAGGPLVSSSAPGYSYYMWSEVDFRKSIGVGSGSTASGGGYCTDCLYMAIVGSRFEDTSDDHCAGVFRTEASVQKSNAQFTSVSASAAGSSFTFAAGNPLTEGYVVGNTLRFSNLSEALNNADFEITAFSGTPDNNRTVTVTPAPTDMSADTAFNVVSVGECKAQHLLRMQYVRHSVVANSRIARPRPAKSGLMYHGHQSGHTPTADYHAIVNNELIGGLGDAPVSIGPQTGASDEQMTHFVWDGNYIEAPLSASTAGGRFTCFIVSAATHLMLRNNICRLHVDDVSARPFSINFSNVIALEIGPIWGYNNTACQTNSTTGTSTFGMFYFGASGADPGTQTGPFDFRNNLGYVASAWTTRNAIHYANANATTAWSSLVTSGNNSTTAQIDDNPNFAGSPCVAADETEYPTTDWMLGASSYAETAGTSDFATYPGLPIYDMSGYAYTPTTRSMGAFQYR
jgi:hypothetical protein